MARSPKETSWFHKLLYGDPDWAKKDSTWEYLVPLAVVAVVTAVAIVSQPPKPQYATTRLISFDCSRAAAAPPPDSWTKIMTPSRLLAAQNPTVNYDSRGMTTTVNSKAGGLIYERGIFRGKGGEYDSWNPLPDPTTVITGTPSIQQPCILTERDVQYEIR